MNYSKRNSRVQLGKTTTLEHDFKEETGLVGVSSKVSGSFLDLLAAHGMSFEKPEHEKLPTARCKKYVI